MGALVGLGVGVGLLLIWSAFALPRTHRVSTPTSTALGRLLGRAGLSDVTRRDSPHFSTTFTCALFPGVLRWVA